MSAVDHYDLDYYLNFLIANSLNMHKLKKNMNRDLFYTFSALQQLQRSVIDEVHFNQYFNS